jgi:hypothetical protein
MQEGQAADVENARALLLGPGKRADRGQHVVDAAKMR